MIKLGDTGTPSLPLDTTKLNSNTWYVANMSVGTRNPVFEVLLYTGALTTGDGRLGSYGKILCSNTGELIAPHECRDIHYIKIVRFLHKTNR